MKEVLKFIYKHKYKILLIILYILFLLQMQNVLLYDDDFDVTYPIFLDQSLSNKIDFIIKKMNFFWFDWSGRIVGHFIVTSGLSLFGIKFFSFLNPIIIFLTSFVCTKILSLIKKINFDKIMFFISLVIISMRVLIARETLYWAYAGILYIWGFLIVLTVFYYLFKYDLKEEKLPTSKLLLIIFLILIQTFFLEQLGLIVIGILGIFILKNIIEKKFNYQHIILLICSIIFFIISVSAPGNFDRVDILITNFNPIDKYTSKLLATYELLLDKNLCGLYIIFLSFLLIVNLFKKGIEKKYYYIPIAILLIGNIIFLLQEQLNILPFFKLHMNFDSLDFATYKDIYGYNTVLMWLIFFTTYFISFFFCLFKNINKKHSLLVWLLLICLASTIVPVICLRYIGTRYCLPFIIVIIMTIIYYIFHSEKIVFIISASIFTIYLLPIKYFNLLNILIITIISILLIKIINHKKSFPILIFLYSIILMYNFALTYQGYNYNKKINDHNEEIILNSKSNNRGILIEEIPYKNEKYTWHTFFNDYTSYNIYYTYLNNFISNYYGIDASKIIVKPSDIDIEVRK